MTNRNRLRLLSAFPLLVALAGCESTEPAPSATTTSAASAKGAASAAATAAASATGAASAEVEAAPATLPPDKDTVKGEPVEYEAGGVKLKGYLAYDTAQKDKRPGVLVVHEWWGRNDYAEKRARLVAGLGYTALAVDMYGDGKTADTPDDAKKLSGEVFGDMATAKARFEAAHKLLAEQETTDPDKIAAIGYCFGGGIVLHMARAGVDLDGVASFHGSLGTDKPAEKGAIKAKLLVMSGDEDPMVPADQVEAFKKEMADAGADLKFIGYPGAMHAFTNPAATAAGKKFKLPVAYDKDADQKSWKELEGFLSTIFGAG